jgi:hypothetical protein
MIHSLLSKAIKRQLQTDDTTANRLATRIVHEYHQMLATETQHEPSQVLAAIDLIDNECQVSPFQDVVRLWHYDDHYRVNLGAYGTIHSATSTTKTRKLRSLLVNLANNIVKGSKS